MQTILLITLGKQVSNNYAPCFNGIKFGGIPFYIKLPCSDWYQFDQRLQNKEFKFIYNRTLYFERKIWCKTAMLNPDYYFVVFAFLSTFVWCEPLFNGFRLVSQDAWMKLNILISKKISSVPLPKSCLILHSI